MEDWIGLFLFGAAIIAAMAALSRYQSRRYQTYLANHTAQTEKITAGQRELIAITERQAALLERQVVALERVAAALEDGKS